MKKETKIINNIKCNFIKTNKFKSICGNIYFKTLAAKENITSRSLLRDIMIRSTKNYNSNQKLNLNTMENFDAYYSASTSRIGNYLISSFYFSTLEDKYTKEGNLKNVIDTFYEIIFNPNVKNNAFDDKEFKYCYDKLLLSIDKLKENQRVYSDVKILDYFNKDKAYSYTETKEELQKINNKSLYQEYLNMINNSEISFAVAGNVQSDMFTELLSNVKKNIVYNNDMIINNDLEETGKDIVEIGNGSENVLHVIYYLKNMSNYELNYVMPIYSNIFGGSPSSRLFNSVREKNSLAYYCHSRLEKDDSIIDVVTGLECENYEKALALIKKEKSNMKKITNKELYKAKKELSSLLIESQDYPSNILSRLKNEELFGLPEIPKYLEKLNNVSISDVESLNEKIDFAFSYFLKGSDKNE